MNFEDFCDEQNQKNQNFCGANDKVQGAVDGERLSEKFSQSDIEQVRDAIEEYQNLDREQLFAMLASEARRQKQNGNLTPQKIRQIRDEMSPFLSDEQRQKLDELLNMIG